jgi:outer membrane receptor protein involved in Fe transport
VRQFDVQYTTAAPYASIAWESGPINVDASVRYDKQKASGYTQQGSGLTRTWDPASQRTVNYTVDHTSFSIGGNVAITRDLAAFARVSDGVSFSADRLLYTNPLDGSTPIAINQVQQFEGGVKWRRGGLSAFVTVFNAKTDESNYEVTTQRSTSNRYDAKGIELEAAAGFGDFRLIGGVTLTDAKITASTDASTVGKTPRRQADVIWQLAPAYSFADVELGAAIVGTSKSYGDDANTITLPAYTTVNAFANVQLGTRATVGLGVNNLFNMLGYTEVEGSGHAARAINGRTVKATLKYQF